MRKYISDKYLVGIVLFGLVIRFLFLFYGADFVLGGGKYIAGDTSGWTDSFINLITSGNYTFDLNNKEAYFTRVPGFAFFWGIHYLIFGPTYVYQSVAVSQILLDCVSIFLISSLAYKIFQKRSVALLSALLYAGYPFIIFWVTISYSEILSNFIGILSINLVLREDKKTKHYIILGILSAMAFYVREFVGIILVISLLYIFLESKKESMKAVLVNSLIVITAFLSLYLIWPVRNYVNHDRLVFGRSYGGFKMFNYDYIAYRKWVLCWDNDEAYWITEVAAGNKPNYPVEAFETEEDRKFAQELTDKALLCSSSFIAWEAAVKQDSTILQKNVASNCNDKVVKGFTSLREKYIDNHLLKYITVVPYQNLKKAFFKTGVTKGSMGRGAAIVYYVLWSYRSFLLLMGLLGVALAFKNRKLIPLVAYFGFIYFFWCFLIRYLEMRNFVQVDTIFLIPASYALIVLGEKIKIKAGNLFSRKI